MRPFFVLAPLMATAFSAPTAEEPEYIEPYKVEYVENGTEVHARDLAPRGITSIVSWYSLVVINPFGGGSSCNQGWSAVKNYLGNKDGARGGGLASVNHIHTEDAWGYFLTINAEGCDCAGDCRQYVQIIITAGGVHYYFDGKKCTGERLGVLESGVWKDCYIRL